MYSIGIDSGSSTTKGVLLHGDTIVEKIMLPTGANPRRTMEHIYEHLKKDQKVYCVTTGYGRNLLSQSNKSVTEITCHGVGATFLNPDITSIIDIGGQDSKVIVMDTAHSVKDFLMNDKCAAGTGRFVELISRILQQDLDDLDVYVKNAEPVKISSMCTVFAESEVIGLLAENTNGPDIAMGVVTAISQRTASFAQRLPIGDKVFFSGGLAKFQCIRQSIGVYLGCDVVTDPLSQYAGAIGAAIIGNREINKR